VDVIVCGAQVPFVRGGAELLQENLVTALRAEGHRAELVRIPVGWEKGRLFDAPLAWRMVPLDCDLVITTNFPSYYAKHPRKVSWLTHQHRGAYDAADAAWSDFGYDDISLETQRLLGEWDNRALEEHSSIYTISQVVTDRLARFNGLSSTPLYHPAPLHDRLHEGPYGDYVFSPTRLENNKRPQLTVEALAHCDPSVRGVVAGRGSMLDELATLAARVGVDDRLELAGFVSDERLVELYAGCLAVVYPPADEDYGYVTLQAFKAGKPVITAKDSGGVLEWVEDGVNGFITDGTPEAIGEAIDKLAADRELAARMGAAGRDRVGGMSWRPVVEKLLAG
jgi:glycosyltransferase involved in cell wall biosynthesis